jgi:hypothetical protein
MINQQKITVGIHTIVMLSPEKLLQIAEAITDRSGDYSTNL